MKVVNAPVVVCSFLLQLQLTDGFSTDHPVSFGRSKKIEFSPSSHIMRSMRIPVDSRPISVQRNLLNLKATKQEGEGAEEGVGNSVEDIINGRKKRLNAGYQVASMTYAAASLLFLLMFGMVSADAVHTFYYLVGGGPVTMAIILHILKGSASHDRLGSDTYKRLNIAVISYAILQLLMPMGALGWRGRVLFKVPGILALVNGIKGYGYGCLGWDKSKDTSTVLADFKGGIQSTLKGLTIFKAKSAGYLFGTLLHGALFCMNLVVLCTSKSTAKDMSTFTSLSKLARLGLMTTIMYTLKDASDRDRLGGTTFVQLNFVAATALFSITLGLLQTYGIYGKFHSSAQILSVVALCAMTFSKGLSNMKKK